MSHRRQPKLVPAAAGLFVLWAPEVQSSFAQIVYEPFAYPAGPLDMRVNPGNGLPWDAMADQTHADDMLVVGPNLSYPDLEPSTGGSVTFGGVGKSQRLSLGSSISSGTIYYSLLLNVTSLSGVMTSPTFIAGFSNRIGASDVPPTTVGTRLYVREGDESSPETPRFEIGVSKNSNTVEDIEFDTLDYNLNTPLMIVGAYQINGSGLGTDDLATLYINPVGLGGATAPVAPSGDMRIVQADQIGTDLFDFDTGKPAVAAFVLRQGNGVPGVPDVQVDELRVDTTWAQATQPAAHATWTSSGNGNWLNNGNWSSNAPNFPGAFVSFPSVASQPHVVTVDAAVSLRTMTFTSPQSYTLNGSAALNFSDAAAINVRAGSHVVSAPINLGGRFLASVAGGGVLSTSGAIDATGRAVAKAGAGTWETKNLRAASLVVHGGVLKILPDGTSAATSRLGTLETSPVGKLDLANNALIVTSMPANGWTGQTYAGVAGLVASGRNGGTWDGGGIVTSDTRATSISGDLLTIGVVRAGDVNRTFFGGQSVGANDTLVMTTWGGDANLDGKINIDDYGRIDGNIAQSGSVFGWFSGDFNYDGKINIDDYGIIDGNINRQGAAIVIGSSSSLAGVASVPEPVLLAPAVFAAMGLRRRRH